MSSFSERLKGYSLVLLPVGAIVLGIATIILALLNQNPTMPKSTKEGDLKIFFNRQVLILYVPNTLSSLEGFAFEVAYDEIQRRVVGLNEFSETVKLSLRNFPSPVCISFSESGGGLFRLPECSEITKITQPIAEQQAFWINPETNTLVDVRILKDNKIVAQCEPNTVCSIPFIAGASQ